MPWLRAGDNAATYPKLMAVAAFVGSDERTVNEVFGWLVRCALQSAGHKTDYIIDIGTAHMLGGARTPELIRILRKAGLLKSVKVDGLAALELHADPEFLHMRPKAEIDWDSQRKRDNSKPALVARVRLRDGDCCRYCGVVTWWGTHDRKSGRVGTIDHVHPGQAGTVATMVVACKTCNSRRQDQTDALELLPEPAERFYSAATAAYLQTHLGVEVPVSQRPGSQPDHAPVQRTGQRPVNAASSEPADGRRTRTDTASDAGSADPRGPVSGFVGSGRDGPGLAGSGRAGARGRRSRRRDVSDG